MEVPFYDNYEPEPADDGWLDVERIYCFDWDMFDNDLSGILHEVFASLPEYKGRDRDGCHWWYSDHEDVENGYLTAGVEPPGLQVFGTLRATDWKAWDCQFRRRSDGLPVRRLHNG